MNFVLKNIFVFFIFSVVLIASEKTSFVSHREVINKLCSNIAEMIAKENVQHVKSVTLKMNTDSLSQFFKQQFIHSLVANNIQVSLEPIGTETTLEVEVRESSVIYGEVFSESLFGEQQTERTISVDVASIISHNTDGKILYAKSFVLSSTDTIAYSSVKQIHDSSIPITSYQAPMLSFFDSILEPAIITVASGIAIYLFFTIRS